MTAVLGAPGVRAAARPVLPVVYRLRLFAVCLFLTVLAFVQSPGQVAGDTKLDLTVSPFGFLSRALHLWDPQGAFGQLQNQATGYLLPMGPFFALGHLIGLPAWVVQRSWWSLLMVLAFLGFVRLAGRLGIGTPLTRVLAGVGFALSPRVVSVLGTTSVEALPLCMTPWVLLPLVAAAQGRVSARAGAARSGLAVALIGGVNAVATFAALPVAALFLLCCVRGRTQRRLLVWWPASVVLATLWWLVPLFLLGKYSPPFLSYIESSAVTTGLTSPAEALRGTSDWIGFLATQRGPAWPAAWRLVTDPITIINTLVLAGLGVVGLTRRDLPYRAFLLLSVLLGMVLVTAGHVGPVDGLGAGLVRTALDGALAPFRNVHKFDAVLRLPLLLAACHALSILPVRFGGRPSRLTDTLVVRSVGTVALLGLASPLLLGLAIPRGGFGGVPVYWHQVASFLADHDEDGRALLVPGSSFADYDWGSTGDEPLQALARSPWGVRNGIPLAPAGGIRFLDALQERFAHGTGSVGLTTALRRSGVGLLVVRNDLDWSRTGAPRPVLVHQALADSPGITRIASFGPFVGVAPTARSLPDAGLDLPYPAVEVFSVGAPVAPVQAFPVASAVQLVGGPEALIAAADQGLALDQATTLAGQPAVPGSGGAELVTDTLRRREVPFSTLPGDRATLAVDEPFRLDRAAHDYLPVSGPARQTVATLLGARRLTASSSGSDVNAFFLPGPQYTPYSAFDGDPTTFWHSASSNRAVGQWLQLDLAAPLDLSTVSVQMATSSVTGRALSEVASLTLTTDQGSVTQPVAQDEVVQTVAVRPGVTRRLRITVASVRSGGLGTAAGIREVTVPGLVLERPLSAPRPTSPASAYLFRTVPLATDACVRVGGRPLCSPELVTPDLPAPSLDRLFSVDRPSNDGVSVTVRPRAGPALDALVDHGARLRVYASSSATLDPASRPAAIVDRDLGTGWVAADADPRPTLELRWKGKRSLDHVQLLVDQDLAASRATGVTVTGAGETRHVAVATDGTVAFPSTATERLVLTFDNLRARVAGDERTGAVHALPVGVSEVLAPALHGLLPKVDSAATRTLPCGSGPVVRLDRDEFQTRITTTVGRLVDLAEVPTFTCGFGPVVLAAGTHRVTVRPTTSMYGQTVQLRDSQAKGALTDAQSARSVRVADWGTERRRVDVSTGPATVLVVHENVNAGWQASLAGRRLRAITVDGWQQGWLVPAGTSGSVDLAYAPGHSYRLGLLAGAGALLGVVGLALRRKLPVVDAPSPQTKEALPRWTLPAAFLLLVLLGGGAGLLVGVVVGAVLRVLRARGRDAAPALVLVAIAALALTMALNPWPSGRGGQSAVAQLLVLVALSATLGAGARQGARGGDAGPGA